MPSAFIRISNIFSSLASRFLLSRSFVPFLVFRLLFHNILVIYNKRPLSPLLPSLRLFNLIKKSRKKDSMRLSFTFLTPAHRTRLAYFRKQTYTLISNAPFCCLYTSHARSDVVRINIAPFGTWLATSKYIVQGQRIISKFEIL